MSLRTLKRRLMRRIGLMPPKYKSFVLGSAENYDSMGRNQFELLRFFGLAEQHHLLDIGCGSLSGGRFAIRLLAPGHYFGIEPEGWLVEEGIRHEIGRSLLESKRPTFSNDANFNLGLFGRRFDYVIAHSILTHASQAQIRILFNETARVMAERGSSLPPIGWARPTTTATNGFIPTASVTHSNAYSRWPRKPGLDAPP
jgi:hypothetical protein